MKIIPMSKQNNVLGYSFTKQNLPRGFSYPLGRAALDAALLTADIQYVHAIYYWPVSSDGAIIRAEYMSEAAKGWFAAGRTSITLYAVPATERRTTNQLLMTDILPAFCSWLSNAERAANVWRGSDHSLYYFIRHGVVSRTET